MGDTGESQTAGIAPEEPSWEDLIVAAIPARPAPNLGRDLFQEMEYGIPTVSAALFRWKELRSEVSAPRWRIIADVVQ